MSIGQPTGSVTVTIAAPPEQVWDLVTDVTRIGEFSPETFEGKWTRGSTGPEVGAHFAGHVKRNGVLPMRVYWLLLGWARGKTNEKGMRTTLERMKAVLEK